MHKKYKLGQTQCCFSNQIYNLDELYTGLVILKPDKAGLVILWTQVMQIQQSQGLRFHLTQQRIRSDCWPHL